MKFAVITIERSCSSELIKILSSKINIIPKPNNHLYPNELKKKYGKNIKIIFITRNIKDVVKSILQREKDGDINWIKEHYKNLNSNFSDYNKILEEDTLNFEKLYDSYMEQKTFDVLFIKYECLYFNHKDTINALCKFTNLQALNIGFDSNNKWKGNHTKQLEIKLSWDKSLQKKINSYDFKLYLKNNILTQQIKIAHLINPFKCSEDNPSYLYYAQPITFKSMHNAQLEAQKKGIDVKLYAINYPEDDEIIPEYFIKLPHLKKSTMSEFPKISGMRKLPIIQEMFDSILQNSDADYIIFTNSDIGVQKNFYIKVNEFIHKDNLKSFIINRRDNISKFKDKKRLTEKDLDIIYKESGQLHPGKDCFIMHRKILEKINMNLMFTGYPPWGYTLHNCMKKIDKKTHLYTNKYLTFHLGCDRTWQKKVKGELWSKNIEISKKI